MAMALTACASGGVRETIVRSVGSADSEHSDGRVAARPKRAPKGKPQIGLHPLGLTEKRDALLYVPPSYDEEDPPPLMVTLHGANSCAERALKPVIPHAEAEGLMLLAPPSRGRTWDVILGSFGPDVAFIERSLETVFDRYAIDRKRVAIEGFSDGASYSLSLGITNGDLFTHVIAFSPGFVAPGDPQGKPPIFVSHGTEDSILPIDATSRRLVPRLKDQGYDVNYIEFDGPHKPAGPVVIEALEGFLERPVGPPDPSVRVGEERC